MLRLRGALVAARGRVAASRHAPNGDLTGGSTCAAPRGFFTVPSSFVGPVRASDRDVHPSLLAHNTKGSSPRVMAGAALEMRAPQHTLWCRTLWGRSSPEIAAPREARVPVARGRDVPVSAPRLRTWIDEMPPRYQPYLLLARAGMHAFLHTHTQSHKHPRTHSHIRASCMLFERGTVCGSKDVCV